MTDVGRGDLFIVSSPSGGGKTTLIRRLTENPPGEPLHFSVSHTTRPKREGEQDGREYHFVSVAEFQEMVQRDEFLEHNEVHDNIYGTSKAEVLPRLAKEFGIGLVAANDVHFLERSHHEAHDVMICIGTGKLVADEAAPAARHRRYISSSFALPSTLA